MKKIEKFVKEAATNPGKWLVYFLLFIFIISIAGILIIDFVLKSGPTSFGREVGKTFLQIISVTVIGTMASLLIALFNSRRTELQKEIDTDKLRIENKNQFRKDILKRISAVYSDTRKSRRMLRAKGVTIPYNISDSNKEVLLNSYDLCMQEINISQLELENIKKEARSSTGIFTKSDAIIKYLSRMERYLNTLLKEYQSKRSKFKGIPEACLLIDLPSLEEFLKSTNKCKLQTELPAELQTEFHKEFTHINYLLTQCIIEDLLK